MSCSASRVVPRAHRVVGPGTHRGRGPREVHTTRALTAWAPSVVPPAAHGTLSRRLLRAAGLLLLSSHVLRAPCLASQLCPLPQPPPAKARTTLGVGQGPTGPIAEARVDDTGSRGMGERIRQWGQVAPRLWAWKHGATLGTRGDQRRDEFLCVRRNWKQGER
jgi:hypothetical protein